MEYKHCTSILGVIIVRIRDQSVSDWRFYISAPTKKNAGFDTLKLTKQVKLSGISRLQ